MFNVILETYEHTTFYRFIHHQFLFELANKNSELRQNFLEHINNYPQQCLLSWRKTFIHPDLYKASLLGFIRNEPIFQIDFENAWKRSIRYRRSCFCYTQYKIRRISKCNCNAIANIKNFEWVYKVVHPHQKINLLWAFFSKHLKKWIIISSDLTLKNLTTKKLIELQKL